MPMKKPKAVKSFVTHPIVGYWKEYESANDWIFWAETLGTKSPSYYLRNRIEQAYQAGWDAAEKYYQPSRAKTKKGE